jgi:hypothetical protein
VKQHLARTIGGAWIAPYTENDCARFGVSVSYMIGDLDVDHDERNLIEPLTMELMVDKHRELSEGRFPNLS